MPVRQLPLGLQPVIQRMPLLAIAPQINLIGEQADRVPRIMFGVVVRCCRLILRSGCSRGVPGLDVQVVQHLMLMKRPIQRTLSLGHGLRGLKARSSARGGLRFRWLGVGRRSGVQIGMGCGFATPRLGGKGGFLTGEGLFKRRGGGDAHDNMIPAKSGPCHLIGKATSGVRGECGNRQGWDRLFAPSAGGRGFG